MTSVEFELAEQFALHTGRHCFITGKAGTGKTTLLKRLVEHTKKNVVVVAPTGVAAVNAGGVTMHSMFGLPLLGFAPTEDVVDPNIAVNRYRLLHDYMRIRRERLQVLRKMDLLIIDEVSMARCDVLDAVDLVLRVVRGSSQPFGGAQVLLIGDVHQLPPVTTPAEENVLKTYYRSPYFFDSLVWPKLNAACIELNTIYRQSDARFLELLNNIRHRRLSAEDGRRLQQRYKPAFKPQPGYVLLATHNRTADDVNAAELRNLPGEINSFTAEIEGDFPEHLYPCDEVLRLKVGAQVMFIRNDDGGVYYNGMLAVVKNIHDGKITVTLKDSGADYTLHRQVWENAGYGIDEHTSEIVKERLGRFSQYPLRLAWAITIHKSQGLTFDKVIIDAGRSFAAGQVYVALSRCRTLEGIVLHSLIAPGSMPCDPRIEEFAASYQASGELKDMLAQEKARYACDRLLGMFAFAEMPAHLAEWKKLIERLRLADRSAAGAVCQVIEERANELDAAVRAFQSQLQPMIEALDQDPGNKASLKEYCGRAIADLVDRIAVQLAIPLQKHIDSLADRSNVWRYLNHMRQVEYECWRKIDRLYGVRFLDEPLYSGEKKYRLEDHPVPVPFRAFAARYRDGTPKVIPDNSGKYRQWRRSRRF